MKIAIIGGGAAGMVCAYLLDKAGHVVTVLEKQPILGGNIRTTHKNLSVTGLADNLRLEGGVIEFPSHFHHFRKLMKELKVELEPVDTGTGLFLKDGTRYLSPIMIGQNVNGFQKIREYIKLCRLHMSDFLFGSKIKKLTLNDLKGRPMKNFLRPQSAGSDWVKNLTMYGYSIPFDHIDNFPAEIGIPPIQDYLDTNWFRIKDGVYTYIEKIIAQFSGNIIVNAQVQNISRSKTKVHIQWGSDQEQYFDKIVFATPPDQVLHLLDDPTEDELRRFDVWKANHARLVIHSDDHFYQPYKIQHPSAFDFFQSPDGWGYNAYLNPLCGVQGNTHYFLAFNMESLINPQKIVHVLEHHTPFYSVEAFQYRDEIINTNGQNNTFHAGAYLGNGLHEGAVVSAENVARLLGMGIDIRESGK